MEARKLLRSRSNKMVAGVCSGLAQYLNVDPTLVRIVWAFAILFAGTGLFAYLICWILIPSEM